MSSELATANNADLIQFDDEKIDLIRRTIAKGATDDELALFLHQCKRTGLDPLARQIYFQKYNTKDGPRVSIITGIDGYRLVADRTGVYAGSDEPVYEGRQEQRRYQDTKQVPVRASVTVYKIVGGKRVPFSASAYWDEYYPGDKKGHMWFRMPHVMLGKVAEAQALRKAFPADLSGVYTREEMDQAGWEDVTPQPAPEPEQEANGQSRKRVAKQPADGEKTDTRGETSPQAQAKRKRPAKPTNGDIDWRARALRAKTLTEFASAAAFALDEYENDYAVTGALNKQSGYEYDPSNNAETLEWLEARKEAA